MKIIEPLGRRVLVHKHEAEIDELKRMEKAGLYTPDVVKQKAHQQVRATVGTVISISRDIPSTSLKEGDIVFFNRWSGTETIVETASFLVLELEEVIGVLREIQDPPSIYLSPPEWLEGEEKAKLEPSLPHPSES